MKKRLSQLVVLNLSDFELASFFYFMTLNSLPPAKLQDVSHLKKGIECTVSMPADIDPVILEQMWNDWKQDSLDWDYAIQN